MKIMCTPKSRLLLIYCLSIFFLIALPQTLLAKLPGSSGGSFAVSKNGAATYRIPISIPPGTQSIEPDLSISYNSQGYNGVMGVGWRLNGLNAITRCSATLRTEPDYIGGAHHDSNDGYCLSGQRLLAVDGVYGADGTEYKTELESYSKIISHGTSPNANGGYSPLYFEVRKKNGRIDYYGKQANARSKPMGVDSINSWLLDRVEDRRGNYYAVTYSSLDSNYMSPVSIKYTGNDLTGKQPPFEIIFNYTERPDQRIRYVAGGTYPLNSRLNSITTKANGNTVREYNFTYQKSPNTSRSRLTQVQECGSLGNCLEPTRFTCKTEDNGYVWSKEGIYNVPKYITDLGYNNGSKFLTSKLVDLNGDGLPDWVMAWRASGGQAKKKTWLQTETGWTENNNYKLPGFLYDYEWQRTEPLKRGVLVDVNGDGLVDWVTAWRDSTETFKETWINTGEGWEIDSNYTLPDYICDTSRFETGEYHGTFADLNGDGLVDWVVAWKGNYHNGQKQVWINKSGTATGNVWEEDASWNLPNYLINYSIMFDVPGSNLAGLLIDLNGDSLPDYIQSYTNWSGTTVKRAFLNSGAGWEENTDYELPDIITDFDSGGSVAHGKFIDVNGDGLVDWVRAYKDPWGVGRKKTWLNTGKGWEVSSNYQLLDVIFDYEEYIHQDPERHVMQRHGSFVDVNNDGLIDWVKSFRQRSTLEWKSKTLINTGTGWEDQTSSYPVPGVIHDYGSLDGYNDGFDKGLYADIDGDGDKDWIKAFRKMNGTIKISTAVNQASAPDVIVKVTDDLGADIDIAYLPLTDSNVYQQETDSPFKGTYPFKEISSTMKQEADSTFEGPTDSTFKGPYPFKEISSTMKVVASVAKDSKLGDISTKRHFNYSYLGAKYDVGRGWLGFRILSKVDQEKNITKKTYCYQPYPLTKLPYLQETVDENDIILKIAITQYKANDQVQLYTVAPQETGCDSYPCRVDFWQENVSNNDLYGSLITKRIFRRDVIDSYGNTTTSSEETWALVANVPLLTSTITTESIFENRSDEWLIGLPTRVLTTSVKNNDTRTRLVETVYNLYGEPDTIVRDSEKAGLSLTTTLDYDFYGNITEKTASGTDALPRTTITTYDSLGHHVTSITNSLGHLTEMTSFDYNCGKHTSITDPNLLTTDYEYDEFCRKIKETRPDNSSTNISYVHDSVTGEYSIQVDTDGGATTVDFYDYLNRNYSTHTREFDNWSITHRLHDNYGRLLQKSRPYFEGDPIYYNSYEYDLFDRITSKTAPDGGITSFNYDGEINYNGMTTVITNPLGQTKTVEKNPDGTENLVIDDLGNEIDYHYDAAGNLIQTIDPFGNTVSITFDGIDRKVTMDDPDLGLWSYEYNIFGDLLSQTDGNSMTISMVYDQLGRKTERTTPEGTYTWVWDTVKQGYLTEVSGPNYTRQHQYDSLSRLSSVTTNLTVGNLQETFTSNNSYDTYSRISSISNSDSGLVRDFAYSDYGTLNSKTVTVAATTLTSWNLMETDARGRATLEKVNSVNGLMWLRNSHNPQKGYIEEIQAESLAGVVQQFQYDWDTIGNLQTRTDALNYKQESFTYDELNRLKTATLGTQITSVNYDGIGNITWKSDVGTYTYGENGAGPHAVTSVDTTTALTTPYRGFSPQGGYQYDNVGNLVSGGGRNVEWTGFNKPSRMFGSGGVDILYSYGPEDQRLVKDVDGGLLTAYRDKDYRVEYDENGVFLRYLVTVPLGSITGEVSLDTVEGDSIHYLLPDHLGSPATVLDEDFTVIEKLSFDPWGQRRDTDWSAASNEITATTPIGFTGHEMDDEISLVNMNARMYDPVLGRFLSADPLIPYPDDLQSFNRYSYVKNNPLNRIDPLGLRDLPGKWDNGVVTNNTSNRDITVVDNDNRNVQTLGPGETSDNDVDMDFAVDDGDYTKIGPNNVSINEDGSYTQTGIDLMPGKNARPANADEIRDVNSVLDNPSTVNGSDISDGANDTDGDPNDTDGDGIGKDGSGSGGGFDGEPGLGL